MGNSASKAARTLPKRSEVPPWAGKRTPNPPDLPSGVTKEHVREKLASERRTEAIEKDARDPHLLANLQQLGPVKVDHHMETIRPEAAASNTQELFRARQNYEYELEAAQQRRGPIGSTSQFYTSQLSNALNIRKGIADAVDAKAEIESKRLDFEKLESISRFVNTPTIAKGSVRTFVDKDGNERTIAKAVWIDAPYVATSKQPPSKYL